MMQTGHRLQACLLLSFVAVIMHVSRGVHGQVPAPTRLKYNVLSQDRIQISWKAPKGKFEGINLLITPKSGGKTNQLTLKPSATRAIIQGLDPDQSYLVKVLAFNGDEESRLTLGQFRIRDLENKRNETAPKKLKVEETERGTESQPKEGKVQQIYVISK